MMRDQQAATESPETRNGSGNCSDKENEQMREALQVQQEILDKLKHDTAGLPSAHLQAEQWLNYQKLRASTMSDSATSAMVNQQAAAAAAAEMLRRDALMSLQSRQPKLDCFNPLAVLNSSAGMNPSAEPRAMSRHSHTSNSPSRSSQSPDEGEEGDVKLEMMSPNVPTNGGQWTYEEQFKQLYEIDNDPERKVFLDDLFAFSQRKGTPVNRIPIMAKQTLDMYKLFKLVVSKGGLVEVINKKLWREITKGLSLPSSITSAAFTLRTQYMKYLYTYECEKFGFSSPSELQSAIDGNRREGRRPGYGYDMPSPSIPSFYGQQGFPNGNPFFNPLMSNPMASLLSSQLQGAYMNGGPITGPPVNHPRLTAPTIPSSSAGTEERSQSPINVSSPHRSILPQRLSPLRRSRSPEEDLQTASTDRQSPKRARANHTNTIPTPAAHRSNTIHSDQMQERLQKCSATSSPLPPPEPRSDDRSKSHISISGPQFQINNQSAGTESGGAGSVSVSMEVNGVLYKGTLYANKDE